MQSKNEIVLHDTYAEIILYDRSGNEKARALIDLDDIERVKDIRWHLDGRGYVVSNDNTFRLHRLIMNCQNELVVDHINRIKTDNRKQNLRICTHQQNDMNRNTLSLGDRMKKYEEAIVFLGIKKEINGECI